MTFRDEVLKKLRRRIKSLKQAPERRASVQACIEALESCHRVASRETVKEVLAKYDVLDLMGGFDE
jgi:hypothetical protein